MKRREQADEQNESETEEVCVRLFNFDTGKDFFGDSSEQEQDAFNDISW